MQQEPREFIKTKQNNKIIAIQYSCRKGFLILIFFPPFSVSFSPHLGLITPRPGTFKQICLETWHGLMVAGNLLAVPTKNRAWLEGKESSSAGVRPKQHTLQMSWEVENCLKHLWPLPRSSTAQLLSLCRVEAELQMLQGRTQQPPAVCSLHVRKEASKICLYTVGFASNSPGQRHAGLQGCLEAPPHQKTFAVPLTLPLTLSLFLVLIHPGVMWLENGV